MRIYKIEGKLVAVMNGEAWVMAEEQQPQELNAMQKAASGLLPEKMGLPKKKGKSKYSEEQIREFLRKSDGDVKQLAKLAKISRFTAYAWKRKFKSDPPAERLIDQTVRGSNIVKVECDECGFTFTTRQDPGKMKCPECQGNKLNQV